MLYSEDDIGSACERELITCEVNYGNGVQAACEYKVQMRLGVTRDYYTKLYKKIG